jgi:hypothetical protein
VDEEIKRYLEDIFEHPDTWEDYIEDDDEEDNEDGEYICPDCDWEGNEKKVEGNTDEE